ncbi:MAG: RsmD family RNA methyltransferase [Alphaproteobacteria bacterium]|nr:RsmD family RNA methyltransferase [Alphaproteobacteria bacterium]
MHSGRVIFGTFKRRLINLPSVKTTRPTTDLLKESIFNCLIHRFNIQFEEWSVIDLFAGSGALGIESASLGAQQVLFFECNNVAFNCIKSNINNLNITDISYVGRINVNNINWKLVFKHITNKNIIVFMDPPYKETELLIKHINIFKDNFNFLLVIETNTPELLEIYNPCYVLSNRSDKSVVFIKHDKYI